MIHQVYLFRKGKFKEPEALLDIDFAGQTEALQRRLVKMSTDMNSYKVLASTSSAVVF